MIMQISPTKTVPIPIHTTNQFGMSAVFAALKRIACDIFRTSYRESKQDGEERLIKTTILPHLPLLYRESQIFTRCCGINYRKIYTN